MSIIRSHHKSNQGEMLVENMAKNEKMGLELMAYLEKLSKAEHLKLKCGLRNYTKADLVHMGQLFCIAELYF